VIIALGFTWNVLLEPHVMLMTPATQSIPNVISLIWKAITFKVIRD
jgi:hypothetical protein